MPYKENVEEKNLCREGEGLGWPSAGPEPMMAPLGTVGKKSVLLTLHECN